MKKLGPKGMKLLKVFHIIFSSMWVGGCLAIVFISLLMSKTDIRQSYGYYLAMEIIDNAVIIPGAAGCMITGLIYSIFTGWGFVKFRWVAVKWILYIAQFIFGTFFLNAWMKHNIDMLNLGASDVLTNATFRANHLSIVIGGFAQTAVLLLIVGISVIKPWNKVKVSKEPIAKGAEIEV